jgi:ElaB/YqjD/DUF883 family membrane-anchored ribosome-binding protein
MANFLNKILKFTYTLKPILHNRIILYLFAAVALFELIYFLNIQDIYSASTLVLIGLLTSFFNKNMTVILFIAIVLTHVLKYGRKSYSEGMDTMDKAKDSDKNINDEDESDKKNKPKPDKESTDKALNDLSKLGNISDKLNKVAKSSDTEKDKIREELINSLSDMKETRNKIVENVQQIAPLVEKFQGYVQDFKKYKELQDQ